MRIKKTHRFSRVHFLSRPNNTGLRMTRVGSLMFSIIFHPRTLSRKRTYLRKALKKFPERLTLSSIAAMKHS